MRAAPAGSPTCPVQYATLLRVVRVSGWSGPSTRSRSVSSCSERGGRAGRVPRLPAPVGEVVAGGQGVGVVGAEHPQLVGEQLARTRRPRRPGPPPPRSSRRGCCGWSGCRGGRGPSTRSRSVSSSLEQRRPRRPGPPPPRPVGEVVAGGQGVGVVGARAPAAGRRAARSNSAIAPAGSPACPVARRRGCCGWSGCRGGRGRAPAGGR